MAEIIPITINGTKIIELETKADWINKIPEKLPSKKSEDEFLFVDKNGNLLTIGYDFRVAEEQGAFPVTVYLAQRTSDAPKTEPKYLMWSGNYVGDSMLFWREGKSGYTTDIDKAHKFDLEDALHQNDKRYHRMISLCHCEEIATRQVNVNHVDLDLIGKEESNG